MPRAHKDAAAPASAGECGAPPAVPRVGLSLAALRAFAEAHADQEFAVRDDDDGCTPSACKLPFAQLTAAQVLDKVVAPATQTHACSYAELLTKQARARGALRARAAHPRSPSMLAR
jgi:hypothetical protein